MSPALQAVPVAMALLLIAAARPPALHDADYQLGADQLVDDELIEEEEANGLGAEADPLSDLADVGADSVVQPAAAYVGRVIADVKLTAYSYESCATPACRTRSGTRTRWGVVSVDPRIIPLGSHLLIDGFATVFIAEDTGGGVRGNHIDIWFPSTAEAVRFGVQYRTVTVLEE